MTTTTTISKQPRLGRLDRFGSNRLPAFVSGDTATVRAASLLLGLELRGWLSRREQEYLDSLGPDNALTFLVHGDRYLHPDDVPLFPLDFIEAAVRQGGDAVFSHRYDSQSASGPGLTRVFTGVIDNRDSQHLVLGMFGPDNPTDKLLLADRFEQVISAFRNARESVHGMLAALGPTPPGAARMLVNRASGRVIHVDPAVCAAVNREPFDFISREYGTVEPLLQNLVRKFKMKIENFACGCLHISCLTFQPAQETTKPETALTTPLLDSLRGDLAGLTTVAEYLSGNASFLSRAEILNLSSEIAQAGQNLIRRLTRCRVLAEFDHLDADRTNILSQLDQAIDCIAGPRADRITLALDSDCENVTAAGPSGSLRLLFETVLETHGAPDTAAATTVRVRRDTDEPEVKITFTTAVPAATRLADLERAWPSDAEQLAQRLGVRIRRTLQTQSNTVVTSLTISPQEISA